MGLGIEFPADTPSSWQGNSEVLLRRFLEALKTLRKVFRNLARYGVKKGVKLIKPP